MNKSIGREGDIEEERKETNTEEAKEWREPGKPPGTIWETSSPGCTGWVLVSLS